MSKWLLGLYYFLIFFLLREWLYPIIELTDVGHSSLFLGFIGMAFLLALIGAKWWIVIPVKVFYIGWAVQTVYRGTMGGNQQNVVHDLQMNFPILMSGEWENMTYSLRTLLFFILLWMGTYLIKYWLEVRKSILLFYVMTIVFITILDAFTDYSAEKSILRMMIIGLVLLGMLTISRMKDIHEARFSRQTILSISIPMLLLLITGVSMAELMPKQEASWQEFATLLPVMKEKDKNEVSKSGYDAEDDRLGGPFLADDTVVFEAEVSGELYWKVETKDTYTSKGWEQSATRKRNKRYETGERLGVSDQLSSAQSEVAKLTMKEQFPFIIYPYGMTTVHTNTYTQLIEITNTGRYETRHLGKEQLLDAYEVEYDEPTYHAEQLKQTEMDALALETDLSAYLQLPDTLPGRVTELAQTITSSAETVYEKAKAIEQYYDDGFVYEQTDVAVPTGDEDYVDQFLFETKQGYCDNFSTSMVVMLRAIDIPARWVKGFAPGEMTENAAGEEVYQVTNNEAHSWVEAYMPGIGWMPFEPTIGFDVLEDFTEEDAWEAVTNQQTMNELNGEEKLIETSFMDDLNRVAHPMRSNKVLWIMLVVGACFAYFILKRKPLQRCKKPIQSLQFNGEDWGAFVGQYKSLLDHFEYLGLKRSSGETLSVYAQRVDRQIGGTFMKELTIAYEEGIYGENRKSQDWQRLQEMWKDLINRTSN